MARNSRRSNGMKKLQPSEMDMLFLLPTQVTGAERYTIDLSQCASLVNRRFYRQGLKWAVAGFTLHTGQQVGSVTISKLPSTWIFSNAWEKGFRAWQKLNNEALDESDSVKPKFLDFKIFANDAHHERGSNDNMKPGVFDSTGVFREAELGEWEYSCFRVPDSTSAAGATQQREIIAIGPSYPGPGASGFNAVSLIEGYANSRGLPNTVDPNAPALAADADGAAPENWLAATFNEGIQQTDDVLTDMVGPLAENNKAPYPFEGDGANVHTMYPGGGDQLNGLVFHDRLSSTTTTISSKISAKGGMFPCGLIQLNYAPEMALTYLQVHLVPGDHRGYFATPMTEM